MKELQHKGYRLDESVFYHEIVGGRHDQTTWGRVMPEFLEWVFE
jgi:hypothetical protein